MFGDLPAKKSTYAPYKYMVLANPTHYTCAYILLRRVLYPWRGPTAAEGGFKAKDNNSYFQFGTHR